VLQHKAERGIVDLELRGMAGALAEYQERLASSLPDEVMIVRASKSLAFRRRVPELDHFKPFGDQQEFAEEAMRVVAHLFRFGKELKLEEPNPR
jgi:hypothetical protein